MSLLRFMSVLTIAFHTFKHSSVLFVFSIQTIFILTVAPVRYCEHGKEGREVSWEDEKVERRGVEVKWGEWRDEREEGRGEERKDERRVEREDGRGEEMGEVSWIYTSDIITTFPQSSHLPLNDHPYAYVRMYMCTSMCTYVPLSCANDLPAPFSSASSSESTSSSSSSSSSPSLSSMSAVQMTNDG